MRVELAGIVTLPRVAGTRDTPKAAAEKLRVIFRERFAAAQKAAKAEGGKLSQGVFAKQFGMQQSRFSAFIAPGSTIGISYVTAKRAIRALGLDEREILGDEFAIDESLPPKERALAAVEALVGSKLTQKVRDRYESLRLWQTTPDGGRVDRDELAYGQKLLQWVQDDIDENPPGPPDAELAQAGDKPEPTQPRPRRAQGSQPPG